MSAFMILFVLFRIEIATTIFARVHHFTWWDWICRSMGIEWLLFDWLPLSEWSVWFDVRLSYRFHWLMTSEIVFVEWFPVSPCKFLADKTIVTYVTPYLSVDLLITCVESHSFAIDCCLQLWITFCGLHFLRFFASSHVLFCDGWLLLSHEMVFITTGDPWWLFSSRTLDCICVFSFYRLEGSILYWFTHGWENYLPFFWISEWYSVCVDGWAWIIFCFCY